MNWEEQEMLQAARRLIGAAKQVQVEHIVKQSA